MASGEFICAIAMTEPGTGSDLQGVKTRAIRDGNDYVINGAKTFISNGHMADVILLVVKTDPAQGAKGISLIAKMYADARVQKIYGGANELMKELIARSM